MKILVSIYASVCGYVEFFSLRNSEKPDPCGVKKNNRDGKKQQQQGM